MMHTRKGARRSLLPHDLADTQCLLDLTSELPTACSCSVGDEFHWHVDSRKQNFRSAYKSSRCTRTPFETQRCSVHM